MKIIRLNRAPFTKAPVYVNFENVKYFEPASGKTEVVFTDGERLLVMEFIEDILMKL